MISVLGSDVADVSDVIRIPYTLPNFPMKMLPRSKRFKATSFAGWNGNVFKPCDELNKCLYDNYVLQ